MDTHLTHLHSGWFMPLTLDVRGTWPLQINHCNPHLQKLQTQINGGIFATLLGF